MLSIPKKAFTVFSITVLLPNSSKSLFFPYLAELPPAVVAPAGRQSQPGVDLLGLGELRHEWLQQVLGNEPQRHALDADQLVDLLLEELGRHALLALGQHGHLAELTEPDDRRHASDDGLQCLAFLPPEAQGEGGQGSLVREDLDAVHG